MTHPDRAEMKITPPSGTFFFFFSFKHLVLRSLVSTVHSSEGDVSSRVFIIVAGCGQARGSKVLHLTQRGEDKKPPGMEKKGK